MQSPDRAPNILQRERRISATLANNIVLRGGGTISRIRKTTTSQVHVKPLCAMDEDKLRWDIGRRKGVTPLSRGLFAKRDGPPARPKAGRDTVAN